MNLPKLLAGFLLCTSCVVHAGLTAPTTDAINQARRDVNLIADEYLESYFQQYPEQGTFLGIPGTPHDKLGDISVAAIDEWHKKEDRFLMRLELIEPELLENTPEYVTYLHLREQLEANVGERVCRSELWEIGPLHSWPAMFSLMAEKQPVGDNRARKQTLMRWQEMPRYMDQEIVNLRTGIKQGYVAAKPVVERLISQIDDLLNTPIEDSPLYLPAIRDKNKVFARHLKNLIQYEIHPAIEDYRDFLAETYLPKSREKVGVKYIPKGKYCYRAKIRSYTALNLPARGIYRQGMSEIKKIHQQLSQYSQKHFNTQDPLVMFEHARNNEKYMFKNEAEILSYNYAALKRIKENLPEWFGILPHANLVIKPYPQFLAKGGAPGEYHVPDENGTPGVFMINTYQANHQSKVDSEATLFHEAIPGHHMQLAIALEQKHLHPLNRYAILKNDGFVEGWALYSERLALEMDQYSSTLDEIGLLSNEAVRAARMVVDPGLHMMGWSRQRAIDYLLKNTAMNPSIAVAEVDRYISMPGQATAYMLGALEIRSLRNRAKEQLGAGFDVRQFHKEVLKDGNINLRYLKDKINRWIISS